MNDTFHRSLHRGVTEMETVYFAGGCLWGVQAFIKTLPGVTFTEAGRANVMAMPSVSRPNLIRMLYRCWN